jgi:hypothetical protein
LACGRAAAPGPGEAGGRPAAETLQAFFDERLTRCAADADCITGKCDLAAVFTISVTVGYCATFPNAYQRWQKIELAEALAKMALADATLKDEFYAMTDDPQVRAEAYPGEKEIWLLVLRELGTPEALARIRSLREAEQGPLRREFSLALAETGDPVGLDDVVAAALSSDVAARMHAAAAAGGLCVLEAPEAGGTSAGKTATGLLAELLEDSHALVRQSAASALTRCGESGRQILQRRLEQVRAGQGQAGDRFMVESALWK